MKMPPFSFARVLRAMSIYIVICEGFKLIHALKGVGILFLSWNFDRNIFYHFSLQSSFSWSFLSTPRGSFYQFCSWSQKCLTSV